MSQSLEYILHPGETELYVKTLEASKIEDLGCMRWFEAHDRFQKLHQQSILEAGTFREESVKEAFLSFLKIPVLIQEAICISVWREKIFPFLLEVDPAPKNTFMPYIVLYHEATAVALLETLLFHQECCEALEDTCIDLIDYCAFYIVRLSSMKDTLLLDNQNLTNRTSTEELRHQQKELAYDIGMRCISILNYMSQALERLPAYATARMFDTHDVPMMLKNLLETSPWMREDNKGNILKYTDGNWKPIKAVDKITISRTEGQIWLCIRQLLLDPKCLSLYDLNDYRKNQLLQLQGYLNDILVDQLPPLMELKRWLSQVALCNVPTTSKRPLIVELVPQIRQNMLKRSKEEWKRLIEQQIEMFFHSGENELMAVAKRLKSTFDLDTLEILSTEPRSCSGCGEPASKRCSRCKTHWFCGRECQVKNWPKHKIVCDQLNETMKKNAAYTEENT